MTYAYTPSGVCSTKIDLSVENGVIGSVSFTGGCSGNSQGISRLVAGMDADEAVRRLKGIKCGKRNTSCPDQLAKAIEESAKA